MTDGENIYQLLNEDLTGKSKKELQDTIIYLRDWYRLLKGECEALNRALNRPDHEKEKLKETVDKLTQKNNTMLEEIKRYRGKKLTLSERFLGKIK